MTNKLYRKFIFQLLVITAVIVAVSSLVFTLFIPQYFSNLHIVTLVYFVLVIAIGHFLQLRYMSRSKKSANIFLLFFVIKFFVYLIYYTILLITNKEQAISFTIVFLGLYLVYTTFEVIAIVYAIKKLYQK